MTNDISSSLLARYRSGNLNPDRPEGGDNGGGEEGPTLPQVASATLLLDLEADTLSLSDGDPVSLWEDQSGNGHDFTQTGGARPTKQTDDDDYSYVVGDADVQYMDGPNFAANPSSIGVIYVWAIADIQAQGSSNEIISKLSLDTYNPPRWAFGTTAIAYVTDESNFATASVPDSGFLFDGQRYITSSVVENYNTPLMYIDGDDSHSAYGGGGTVTTVENSDGTHLLSFSYARLYAVLIYQITDLESWPTDRAAIEAWLADRYGVTL